MRLHAVGLGAPLAHLRRGLHRFRVHSAYHSVVNLLPEEVWPRAESSAAAGEVARTLVSLAHAEGSRLPHGIVVDLWHPCLSALVRGRAVWLVGEDGADGATPGAIHIETAGAALWDPSVVGLAAEPAPGWAERLREAWRLLSEGGRPESLAALVGPPRPLDPFQRRSAALAGRLLGALSRGEDPAPAAEGLIGLGPGLTPAGDDLLTGLLIGAWSLSLAPAEAALRDRLAQVAAAAHGSTTDVSAAYLYHAAQGRATGRLRDVLLALARPDPRLRGPGPRLAEAIPRALAMGRTSGADGLLGLLSALTVWSAQDLWPPGLLALIDAGAGA
jgi:hypothetical protein